MIVGGIDEAGRGPVVGPMVVAIVAGDEEELKRIGAKDSKALSRSRREELYVDILAAAECINYVVIEPYIIDQRVRRRELNRLELEAAAQLIGLCDADLYYIDSPDPKPERFGAALRALSGREVVAMNKAERMPSVAAASIIAKVVRDRLIDLLKAEMGDFGSGYPSDPKTISALRSGRVAPECIRHSWKLKTA
ncbi:MAG: ribonuclease HII [Thermoproteus sp.]